MNFVLIYMIFDFFIFIRCETLPYPCPLIYMLLSMTLLKNCGMNEIFKISNYN